VSVDEILLKLTARQRADLLALAEDPAHVVEASSLGTLRRLGLVTKRVETTWENGRSTTRTTSPPTDFGRGVVDLLR